MFVDFNILNQLGSPSINSNTFANRPAAGQTGRLFVSTDTFEIYRDNGTGWDLIGGPGSSTVTGSGATGQVTYWTGTNTVGGENNLWWDAANNRLGINTSTPGVAFDVHSAADVGVQLNGTGATPSILQQFLSAGVAEYEIGYNWNTDINYRRFSIYDSSGVKEVISIDKQSRYVGINYQYSTLADQPAYTLDVSGAIRSTDFLYTDTSVVAKQSTSTAFPAGYSGFAANSAINSIDFANGTTGDSFRLIFPTGVRTFTFPNNTGTIALTSDIPSLSGYVQTSRTLTINGTSFDLSANRSWTVGTITGSGTTGYIPYFTGSTSLGISGMYWNAGTSKLSINAGVLPTEALTVSGNISGNGNAILNSGTSYLLITQSSGSVTSSAALEVQSTTKGFLPPKMTTAQRDFIITPSAGLSIYNTTTNTPNYYNGTSWQSVGGAGFTYASYRYTFAASFITATELVNNIGFVNTITAASPYIEIASSGTPFTNNKTFVTATGFATTSVDIAIVGGIEYVSTSRIRIHFYTNAGVPYSFSSKTSSYNGTINIQIYP